MVCLAAQTSCTDNMVGDTTKCTDVKVKRSIEASAQPDEHSVSLGPLIVKRETSEVEYTSNSSFLPCSLVSRLYLRKNLLLSDQIIQCYYHFLQNNGGCSELCVNTYASGHVCACLPGRVLNDDGVSCMGKLSMGYKTLIPKD